ncbi:multiple sugar transport system permease protein [Paenibacillus sp. UNC496MF]|uniref:carbohydrate ABC transporter permease n=1 Tax=Paenibacillus sp. UNC496MF TaxID=1502753 RepID=UPI0008EFF78C|nr:carbohydrate ABC transporter permease [Paenibacillus sp. UNC496MF]SFI31005.1 multiple sugar transport system permease protein [Paenibacillus sp. UNC496MF]
MKAAAKLSQAALYLFLALAAAMTVVPYYWMISTSLKSAAEVVRVPPTLFPTELRRHNYIDAIVQAPLLTYVRNNLIVGMATVTTSTFVSVLAAFAFARLRFRAKNVLFFVVLSMMTIPQEMLIITNFQTIAHWGWMNTWEALIVPYCVNPFNIYLLRQTFMQVPDELYQAAKVDGLTNFRYLTSIVLPLSKSAVVTTLILSMIVIWHTFAWPNLVTTQDSLRLVSNGLQNAFTSSVGTIAYELQMAAAAIVTFPLIIMFLLLRKQVLSGMIRGGIKG